MIVVSHRGPYRFEPVGDGSYASERGAGGLASALGAVIERGEHDVTWIAAAISDDDRSAAASGSLDDLAVDLRLVAFDPKMHSMHYDVVSNSVLLYVRPLSLNATFHATASRLLAAWRAHQRCCRE